MPSKVLRKRKLPPKQEDSESSVSKKRKVNKLNIKSKKICTNESVVHKLFNSKVDASALFSSNTDEDDPFAINEDAVNDMISTSADLNISQEVSRKAKELVESLMQVVDSESDEGREDNNVHNSVDADIEIEDKNVHDEDTDYDDFEVKLKLQKQNKNNDLQNKRGCATGNDDDNLTLANSNSGHHATDVCAPRCTQNLDLMASQGSSSELILKGKTTVAPEVKDLFSCHGQFIKEENLTMSVPESSELICSPHTKVSVTVPLPLNLISSIECPSGIDSLQLLGTKSGRVDRSAGKKTARVLTSKKIRRSLNDKHYKSQRVSSAHLELTEDGVKGDATKFTQGDSKSKAVSRLSLARRINLRERKKPSANSMQTGSNSLSIHDIKTCGNKLALAVKPLHPKLKSCIKTSTPLNEDKLPALDGDTSGSEHKAVRFESMKSLQLQKLKQTEISSPTLSVSINTKKKRSRPKKIVPPLTEKTGSTSSPNNHSRISGRTRKNVRLLSNKSATTTSGNSHTKISRGRPKKNVPELVKIPCSTVSASNNTVKNPGRHKKNVVPHLLGAETDSESLEHASNSIVTDVPDGQQRHVDSDESHKTGRATRSRVYSKKVEQDASESHVRPKISSSENGNTVAVAVSNVSEKKLVNVPTTSRSLPKV